MFFDQTIRHSSNKNGLLDPAMLRSHVISFEGHSNLRIVYHSSLGHSFCSAGVRSLENELTVH